ncbi:MAG TPA: hypothetical protein VHB30_10820 [Solirubrobacteraceae bacterium]|nr:hypothetical protein [Solirubrobacteraceae bacterium]
MGTIRRQTWSLAAAGALLALVALALLGGGRSEAAVKNATDVPFMYVTDYSGAYTFEYHSKTNDGVTVDDGTGYEWDDEVTDVVTPAKNGTFHEIEQITTSITGARRIKAPQQVPPPPSCVYYLKPQVRTVFQREGSYDEAVPLKKNPKATVTWSVPEPGLKEPEGVVSGAFGLTEASPPVIAGECPGGKFSFGYALDGCAVCNFSFPLAQKLGQPSATFRKLWSGSQVVSLKSIYKKDFVKKFHEKWTKSATSPGGSGTSESATLNVNSQVTFSRVVISAGDAHKGGNKVGTLLEKEGIQVMSGITRFPYTTVTTKSGITGYGPGYETGSPETIVVPGIPEPGTVTAEISGTVVSGGKQRAVRAAHAAAAAVDLGGGSVKTDPTGGMIALKLTPSAAGAKLLKASHGSIHVKVTMTFKPSSGASSSEAVTGTIPATS